ncbi:MAG: DUF2336 domain-containing protein [Caulobacterales bacterium]|nr:DUF2336 domain-containing protein [Caulobacterales bacterium]
MTDSAASPDLEPRPLDAPRAPSRSRRALLKRLADVVSLPGSRVNAFERAVVGDLLVEMLREAEPSERLRIAQRLAPLTEIPDSLVRLLLRDESGAAELLLEHCTAFSDADLISCALEAGHSQRLAMAGRRHLSEATTDALVAHLEPAVLDRLLRNREAKLSQTAIEDLVAASREAFSLIDPLLKRSEMRPSSAYVMFWWGNSEQRRTILSRFAVSREVLQEVVDDVFAMAAEEGWQDALSRKALQFIERRQRNRAAIEKSPFDSLDHAVEVAANGLTRELVSEISFLAGIKPMTGAKIFTDMGGEPVAILCKATGLPKTCVRQLWRGMRRPEVDENGEVDARLAEVLITYDMIAVDRAQTVLRYWNWSLSSALTPQLMRAIRDGNDEALDEYSVPQRAAMLALTAEFGRQD